MKPPQECLERETLFAYCQRMLEPSKEAAVNMHLEACEACRNAAKEYTQLDLLLSAWPQVEPSPWFDARMRAAIDRAAAAPSPWSFRRLRWLAPLSAALVVVLAMVVLRPRHPASAPAAKSTHGPVAAATPSSQAAQESPNPPETADQELKLYENLPVLENYDMLANFDVLSELPQPTAKSAD